MSDTEFTEADREDLKTLGIDPDAEINRTLLEIWRTVLGNIEEQAGERIHPQTAQKVVSAWPKLSFQDTPVYHERYFEILTGFREILDEVIAKHPGCLKNVVIADDDNGGEGSDAIANRDAYLDLIAGWQFYVIEMEAAWDARDSDSHIEIAAIADATAFCAGEQGLIQHLSSPQVGFVYGEAEHTEVGERIAALSKE